jgi:hypothetical protein
LQRQQDSSALPTEPSNTVWKNINFFLIIPKRKAHYTIPSTFD